MSEYIRTTRECAVSQLHPELLLAIQKYFQEHELGNEETETQLCCETISRRKKDDKLSSWLSSSPDATFYTGILLTAQWLIWGRYGEQSGTTINAANLNRISVQLHTSLFTNDVGLEISGYIGDSSTRVRGHIGMGPGPAAQKFCEEVRQSINRINPPSTGNIFKWPPF